MSFLSSAVRISGPAALMFCVARPAIAAPVVTLSSAIGHIQSATKVSGSGFGANEAVDIFYDTGDVLLDVTDGTGKFGPDKFTIATGFPGEHWFTAIGRRDGDAAHKRFIVSTAWVSHGFNQRGRRRNPYENVLNVSTVNRLDLAWSATTALGVVSSPALSQFSVTAYDPFIFVGSNDDNLYAFDITGAQKWSEPTGGGIFSSPTVANGNVYVGSSDGRVYAFKATTGIAAWPSPVFIGGAVDESPAVVDGLVLVGSQTTFRALNASDGSPVWTRASPGGGSFFDSSPAVGNGIVYVGTSDHDLYAFHESDGTPVWPGFSTGALINSSPAVANGIVYFGSEDDKVYAVNATSGAAAWASPATTGGTVDSSPAVANGIVFIGSDDGKLYALSATTGATIWTGLTGGPIGLSSPAVANGVVYVGSQDGKIYAFATTCSAACSPLWWAATGTQIGGSPSVSDGMVFIGSLDHNLYAYALDAGNTPTYQQRIAPPPSYTALHPDFRLKPVQHSAR